MSWQIDIICGFKRLETTIKQEATKSSKISYQTGIVVFDYTILILAEEKEAIASLSLWKTSLIKTIRNPKSPSSQTLFKV